MWSSGQWILEEAEVQDDGLLMQESAGGRNYRFGVLLEILVDASSPLRRYVNVVASQQEDW